MATLVESPCLLPVHQLQQNIPQPPHPPLVFPPVLDASATQLAPLASQHHASEYNRHKFGLQGCPITYCPLSLQLPDYYKELQQRQLQSSQGKSFWPCQAPDALESPPLILGPGGAQPAETLNLQAEIRAAMSESLHSKLHDPFLTEYLHPSVKTSSTHPINISAIIPPELIPIISSHLTLNYSGSSLQPPTIFDLPASFTLDRLTSSHSQNTPRVHTPPSRTSSRVALRARSGVKEALHVAINGRLAAVSTETGSLERLPSPTFLPRPVPTSTESTPALQTYHANASSISLSLSSILADIPPAPPSIPVSHEYPNDPTSGHSQLENKTRPPIIPLSSMAPLPFVSTTLKQRVISPRPPNMPIGNLFLSSCPGKKVRLQGPIRGRSGVCRDLDSDLRRIKGLGVGCIVCCLDDSELEFLGAPWFEYEECARNNGIDVLRIPTPEGLAPLTAASLDSHLTYLIDTYTLRGIPILVHCRGGVGRAGVVACCWIIKLGLCGWVEPDEESSPFCLEEPLPMRLSGPGVPPMVDQGVGLLRRDTIQMVRRVIAVVRRRRSMKAVETYEQVRFLVDYVEHLRAEKENDVV